MGLSICHHFVTLLGGSKSLCSMGRELGRQPVAGVHMHAVCVPACKRLQGWSAVGTLGGKKVGNLWVTKESPQLAVPLPTWSCMRTKSIMMGPTVLVHAGLPEMKSSFQPKAYTQVTIALQSLSLAFWLVVMLVMLGLWVKFFMWVASFGVVGVWAVRGLVAYTAASFLVAFMLPAGSSKKQLQAKKQE